MCRNLGALIHFERRSLGSGVRGLQEGGRGRMQHVRRNVAWNRLVGCYPSN